MKKNWKTTLLGTLAGAAYIAFKILSHQPVGAEDFTLALGMAGIGAMAKDHDITGK